MVLNNKSIAAVVVLCVIIMHTVLISCGSVRQAREFSRFRIPGSPVPSTQGKIRTDGIYTYESDYITDGFLFFEDGSFAEISSGYDLKSGYSLYEKFQEQYYVCIFFYGLYKIEGEDILMDRYCKVNFSQRCDRYNMRLLPKDTIEVLSLDYWEESGIENIPYTGRKMHFEPLDTIPITSLMPIKKQRWLWENENDWRDYLVKWKQFKKNRKTFPVIVIF